MCLNAPIIIVLISILIMTIFLKHAKKVGPARGTGLVLVLVLVLVVIVIVVVVVVVVVVV